MNSRCATRVRQASAAGCQKLGRTFSYAVRWAVFQSCAPAGLLQLKLNSIYWLQLHSWSIATILLRHQKKIRFKTVSRIALLADTDLSRTGPVCWA